MPWMGATIPGGMMSEEQGQPEAAAGVESEPVPVEVPAEKTFSEAYVKQLREEAAGYRVKLKEHEDAQKSELERAQEAAAEVRRELAAAQAESVRLRVAAAHGVGADYLDLLTGANEAELEANAVKLAELINKKGDAPEPPKKAEFIIPDEGGVPAVGKTNDIAPGMGTLRAAYAQ